MIDNTILRVSIAEWVRDCGLNWHTTYDGDWFDFTFYLESAVGELGFFCYEVVQEEG